MSLSAALAPPLANQPAVQKPIQKLLVANRSEIAIRIFRAATELNIRTVAIYSYEDRYALHRLKADEAYQIGAAGEPLKNYLNIEAIIACAKSCGADAIHPGYGFLSENPQFARRCRAEGIIFIGPQTTVLEQLGDKVSAKKIAVAADVPTLGDGSDYRLTTLDEALVAARACGYPVMLKAAHGGGGRGMRVVESEAILQQVFASAQNESLKAFGSDEVFVEKYIAKAKHIEVQLLGDQHGNLVHLYERDCSLQRRHQKVVEIAPSPNLRLELREAICLAALKIGQYVSYENAGTVEFLLDAQSEQFYFIEVNPRIQVEHTVTEEVTDVDIVKAQILIACGEPLTHPSINIVNQQAIQTHGFAIQCRVTTEDPQNQFMPDYGRLQHYRSASGAGIRLDAGSAYTGAVINPYFDSMLVKVTARGRTFIEATTRMGRALQEFRVRGLKNNLIFLEQLLRTDSFKSGEATTRFIDDTPSLMQFADYQDRGRKLLDYLADVTVNGHPDCGESMVSIHAHKHLSEAALPDMPTAYVCKEDFITPKQRLQQLGKAGFGSWLTEQKELLVTDTSMRDAHQSLFATRMRSRDMLRIADHYHRYAPQLFSVEMWGGATFDTSLRFLNECPWERLQALRTKMPNTLLQMLLRASSAVGYANYPDNLVRQFILRAADNGIDIFRVFDALNWCDNLAPAMAAIQETDALCEAAICYSGDITNPDRQKYTLRYYIDLAKQLQKMGADIIAIKDMAGLCKPAAIHKLVTEIKAETGLPIHFHTHDTSGMSAASILAAADAGVDVVDLALASLSGNTSQPNMNTLLESLHGEARESQLNMPALDKLSDYWRQVREYYWSFESENLPATADLYRHEIPGGQYSNLYAQAKALGLSNQWHAICQCYADVNQLFGDIVKVTPSSKAVGDMAIFMIANQLSIADVLDGDKDLAFPASVLDLLSGKMGQPLGGFPQEVRARILKNQAPLDVRAGEILPPIDFEAVGQTLLALGAPNTPENQLSYALYPKVFEQYHKNDQRYTNLSVLPTPNYFYGLEMGEEIAVNLEVGKTLLIKLIAVGERDANGLRQVFFAINGLPREVWVAEKAFAVELSKPKADANDPKQIGSHLPGMIATLAVKEGESVKKGQKLLSIEAMKMETHIEAPSDGVIAKLYVQVGQTVVAEELLISLG